MNQILGLLALGAVGALTYKAVDDYQASKKLTEDARTPILPGTNLQTGLIFQSKANADAAALAQGSYLYALGALAITGAGAVVLWNGQRR